MVRVGKGINMEAVRNSNRKAVLSYLNMYGASSRKKIAEDLKLTTATLSIITNELINNNMVLELGEVQEKKVGRKKILIDLNEKARYSLGLEIQKRKIIFVITDLKANIIFEKEWVITGEFKLNDFLKILNFINEKIEDIRNIVLGIGILVQGEIQDNKALNCPIPDVLEIVEKYLGIKAIIENNMTGLVVSELYFREQHNNFWVLKYGPGVGTSVVINGKILYGENNKPAEFGHIPLLDKENGYFCPICKKRGCLESEIHFDRMVEELESKGHIKKKEFGHIPLLDKENGYFCPICKKRGCLESEIHFDRMVEELESKGHIKKKDESDVKFIERVCKKGGEEILEKNLDTIAKYFSIISWTIPVNELILTGEIFSNESILSYFLKKIEEQKISIKKENVHYMKDYSHKKKIAGCLLILKDFFK